MRYRSVFVADSWFRKSSAWCLLLLLLLSARLWGQAGELEVRVTDPSGAVIRNARVLLRTPAGSRIREAFTSGEGVAQLSAVSPGWYSLEVRAENFEVYGRTLQVRAGSNTTRVQLELATVATTIEVAAPTAAPIAVARADIEQLQERPAVDLVEKLRSIPGVNTLRRGGTNFEPVVYGLRETQLAMLVDGTRTFAAGPARMDSELSHVKAGDVEEAQIIRGPYALVEGAGAVSAIVVKTPGVPRFDRWRLRADTYAGYRSNSSGRFGHVRLFGGDDRFGLSLRGSGNKGNDYRPGDSDNRTFSVPGDYSNHQLGGKLRFNPGGNQELSFGGFYDEQTDLDYPGRLLRAEHFLLRSFSGSYLVAEPSDTVKALKFNLYLNKKSHRMSNRGKPTARDMPGRMPPFALSISLPTEADTFGGAGRVDLEPAQSWRIQTGFDFYNLDQDAQRFVSRQSNGFLIFSDVVWPDASINNQGVYLQTTKAFERGEFASALRFDFVQADAGRPSDFFLQNTAGDAAQTEVKTNFSLAGRYRLAEGVSLGGGFGRVVRTANALERYSDRFPSTKFQIAAEFLGEPGIAPETSYQGDIGLEVVAGGLTLNAGAFYRRIDDYITVAPDPSVPKRLPLSPPTVFRYLTGDHANFRGYQFGARYLLQRVIEFRVQGAKTIGDDIEEDTPQVGLNEPVLGIAPLELNSAVRLFEPSGRFWGEFAVRNVWDQQRVAASRFEQTSAGFTSFDLRFGLTLPQDFLLHLGLENLGDKFYFEHLNSLNPFTRQRIPEVGRSFYVSLRKRW